MGRKGEETRVRILDVAQDLILRKGFSAVGIDEIVHDAGITKGGFFYHFKSRNELARELMERYIDDDNRVIRELRTRACELVDAPVDRIMVFLKLYSELLDNMEEVHPGCLVASYTYESQLFDQEIRTLTRKGVESWKEQFLALFEPVLETHTSEVPLDELADMLNALLEGGIIMSRLEGSNATLARQILLFRDYLKRVLEPRS